MQFSPPKRQKGIAILMVLLIVTLLTTIMAYAFDAQHLVVRRVTNQKLFEQSYQLGMGAEQWVINELYRDVENPDTRETDHFGENWNNLEGTVKADVGELNVKATDLSGKLNLNALQRGRTKPNEYTPEFAAAVWMLNNLLLQFELDTRLTGNLVDWIDSDDSDTAVQKKGGGPLYIGGAEDFHYTGLDKPYRAANQPLTSIGELSFVKGFTKKAIKQLSPYITVLPSSEMIINLNTVSAELLQAMSREFNVVPTDVSNILELQKAPKGIPDVASLGLQNGEWMPDFGVVTDVKSRFFLVRSEASFGELRYSMESVLFRDFNAGASGKVEPAKVLKRERVLL